MTDKPEPTKGTDKAEETIFNSDIGDDWGEAFQAEDFMFSPDEEASSEFFLEDDSFEDDKSSTDAEGLFADADGNLFDTHDDNKSASWIDKILGLLAFLVALPPKYRVPAIGLPVALVIALIFFLQSPPETTKQEEVSEQESAAPQQQNAVASNVQQDGVATGTEQAIAPIEPPKEQQASKTADVIDKVRKRWKLPSFFISSFNEKDKETALLSIDLTFVLLLNKEDVIPDENELLVRETIYQFFNNQPYSELDRFALSRGEMNRSLSAWVNKQLPDIPLSSIVFERYQIL